MHTIAFYNIENLFDIYDDESTNDNDFLPDSTKKWTDKRYYNKLRKLGFAMANIAKEKTQSHPAIIGLAEVENNEVIEALLSSKHLTDLPYDYVHFDSPDERGIDVAFVYDTTVFELIVSEVFPLHLYEEDGSPDYTRDILLVTGKLDGCLVHFIVTHWPSRRDSGTDTEYKRFTASDRVVEIIHTITQDTPDAKIIILGDFNEDPSARSVKNLVNACNLYNPMEHINLRKKGSLSHDFKWNLFDQILLSHDFLERKPGVLYLSEANVFDAEFLKLFKGPFKGTPFRTYVGTKYKGGYSDHFPVYIILDKH